MDDELKNDIEELKDALRQLSEHTIKTKDWRNANKWLSELLEIKQKALKEGE